MLDSKAASGSSALTLLTPGAKADTAAATGAWTASPTALAGSLIFIQHIGVVTAGSVAGKIQTADDNSGTNSVDLVSFTSVTTANDDPNLQKASVLATALKPYVRYIGTVTTGPIAASAEMLYSSTLV